MMRKRKTRAISQLEMFPISFVPFEAVNLNGSYRMEYRLQLAEHGLDVCSVCNTIKSIDQFYASKNTRIGRSAECKVCQRQRCDLVRKDNREFRSYRVLMLQTALFSDMGVVCQLCAMDEKSVLEFHHVDPKTKRYNVSQKIQSLANLVNPTAEMFRDLREEADKCALLCSNCHAKLEKNALALKWEKRTERATDIGWNVEWDLSSEASWRNAAPILADIEADRLFFARGSLVGKNTDEMAVILRYVMGEGVDPGFVEAIRWMERYPQDGR